MFRILGQPAATSEPGECPLDDPPAGQNFEALGSIQSLSDLDGPFANLVQRTAQLWPGITAIDEDMAHPGSGVADRFQHRRRAVAVLDIGGVDDQTEQQPDGIDDGMTFSTFGFFLRNSPQSQGFRWFSRSDYRSRPLWVAARGLPVCASPWPSLSGWSAKARCRASRQSRDLLGPYRFYNRHERAHQAANLFSIQNKPEPSERTGVLKRG